jgi:hypothetical protein
MTAFIGLVAGVLVIAGAGGIALTHNAARTQATQQLVTEAQSLTAGTSHTERLAALKVVRRVLRLADARFVRVSPRGAVTTAPPGLTTSDLSPERLLAGDTVSPPHPSPSRLGSGRSSSWEVRSPSSLPER